MKIELWHEDSVVARLEIPPSRVMPVVEFKGQFYVRKGNSQEWQRAAGCLKVPVPRHIFPGEDPLISVSVPFVAGDFVEFSGFEGTVLGCEGGRLQVYCTDGVTRAVGS